MLNGDYFDKAEEVVRHIRGKKDDFLEEFK
jgi:hypothetical protein